MYIFEKNKKTKQNKQTKKNVHLWKDVLICTQGYSPFHQVTFHMEQCPSKDLSATVNRSSIENWDINKYTLFLIKILTYWAYFSTPEEPCTFTLHFYTCISTYMLLFCLFPSGDCFTIWHLRYTLFFSNIYQYLN